jgi:hypothetical protein
VPKPVYVVLALLVVFFGVNAALGVRRRVRLARAAGDGGEGPSSPSSGSGAAAPSSVA